MAYQPAAGGDLFVTVAMGDGAVLDVLGANYTTAQADQVKIDQAMGRQDQQINSGSKS
jgi:hypothetical protein